VTNGSARPTPPRRASGLLLPLTVAVIGAAVGGLTAGVAAGVLWGLIAAAALIIGLRLADIKLVAWETALVAVGFAVSTTLTVRLLPEALEILTPWLSVRLAGVWLLSGLAIGVIVMRRSRPTMAINVALLWAGAGALIGPLGVSLGVIDDGMELLGTSAYIVVSLIVVLIGGSAAISAATGVRAIVIGSTTLMITWFAASQIGFTIAGLVENFANIANVPDFWPPDFTWAIGEGTWWWLPSWDFGSPFLPSPLIETFRIAILAAVTGCLVALPVAFMASTMTAPSRITYFLDKSFMNVIRTIPDLFWAMLFVAAVGVGPLAGVLALFFFSLAIMSKLLSETIDSVDPGPLEAARATGGSHFPAVRVSVFPQVLPNYVAYALYVFEINIRASVVLGLVGAGGIGRVLEAQRAFFQFDRVLAVVIIIFVIVFLIEQVSVGLRRRLV
jgi:phosphonate transport system permease protein